MKTKQTIVFGVLAVILALTFFACDDDEGGTGIAPTITTTTLPNGTVGTAYSQTLAAEGDTPITWNIDTGSLPGGLNLSTEGVISGTPTTADTFNFTVKAANAVGSDTKALSIDIDLNGPRTWTAVTNSTFPATNTIGILTLPYYINDIAYGNGRFVAVGDNGKMAYSDDNGVTWTAVADSTFDTGYSIRGIAYGNNRFVAVGDKGKMAYSDDGTSWTAVTDSIFGSDFSAPSFYAIAYVNNRFVAVGTSGKMAYSEDGENWTAVTDSKFDTSNYSFAIAYGNNRFVAVGNAGKIAYSEDGESWTAVADSTFPATYTSGSNIYPCTIYGIAYGNNKFVAVGANSKMAYSTDGTSWTAVSNSAFTSWIRAIAYGNNRFVAVGGYGEMAYSADGTSWTAVVDSTFGTTGIGAIAYGNNRFVAVGEDGKMAYADWQ